MEQIARVGTITRCGLSGICQENFHMFLLEPGERYEQYTAIRLEILYKLKFENVIEIRSGSQPMHNPISDP